MRTPVLIIITTAAVALALGCAAPTTPPAQRADEPPRPAQQADDEPVRLTRVVTNLHPANSPFDDYNPIVIPGHRALMGDVYFSSNRATQGGTFDIEHVAFEFEHDPAGGHSFREIGPNDYAREIVSRINTAADELGPYAVHSQVEVVPGVLSPDNVFMFARGPSLDIHVLTDFARAPLAEAAVPATGINSPRNDAYPSYDPERRWIYFTSDRAGSFDIYVARAPEGAVLSPGVGGIVELLTDARTVVSRVAELASERDDKCPFFIGGQLFFTSDRDGGEGGFDLYRSTFDGARWSTPENLGPDVNTSHDEYRPILVPAEDFANDLLVFSSDRPGGQGGFDLYYVGLERR